MNKKISFLLLGFLLLLSGCANEKSTDFVRVTWNVKLPHAVPEGRVLSMGSNQNNWTPSDTSFINVRKVDELNYVVTRDFVKVADKTNFSMEYKWVLYEQGETNMWHGVELIAYNANRKVTIAYNAENVFNDTVNSFEHIDASSPSQKKLGDGTLHIHNVNGRRIRIYTPSTYDEEDANHKFPVIYMHDGQNLFETATSFAGEWKVDETLENLIKNSGFGGAIVVGIDNTANRMGEYMYPTGYISYSNTTAVGDAYMDLLVNEIKPYVDENFHTFEAREHTLLAGSSMGGLISFFGGIHHLETFGTIIAFSTSTQLVTSEGVNVPHTLNNVIDNALLQATKFFFYVGTTKDGDATWPASYKNYLTASGVASSNVATYIGLGYTHNEHAWATHLPIALKWAFNLS